MSELSLPIIVLFLLTTLLALFLFERAVSGSRAALGAAIGWILVESAIALSGYFMVTDTIPPRLFTAIAAPLILIAGLFLTANGRQFLDAMDLKWCVLMHSVRILVELNLYWLFVSKQVPKLMTFEGGNVDILAGLSAPVIWWAYRRGHVGRRGLLIWNGTCLLSVLNAFVRAILSAPFRFQRFAFDQPTIAIVTFPFVLLPAFIVPAVLLCHLVLFRKLARAVPLHEAIQG